MRRATNGGRRHRLVSSRTSGRVLFLPRQCPRDARHGQAFRGGERRQAVAARPALLDTASSPIAYFLSTSTAVARRAAGAVPELGLVRHRPRRHWTPTPEPARVPTPADRCPARLDRSPDPEDALSRPHA